MNPWDILRGIIITVVEMLIRAVRRTLRIHSPSGHITGGCWCSPGPAYDSDAVRRAFDAGAEAATAAPEGQDTTRALPDAHSAAQRRTAPHDRTDGPR